MSPVGTISIVRENLVGVTMVKKNGSIYREDKTKHKCITVYLPIDDIPPVNGSRDLQISLLSTHRSDTHFLAMLTVLN